jgi:hypothetical protein
VCCQEPILPCLAEEPNQRERCNGLDEISRPSERQRHLSDYRDDPELHVPQSFGLKLAEIRELLEIHDKGACPCGHTKVLVERRIDEIDIEMKRLRARQSDRDGNSRDTHHPYQRSFIERPLP